MGSTKHGWRWMICLIMLVSLVAGMSGVQASQTKGSIQGVIRDQAGNPVAAAEITLLNLETGYYQTITSRDDGGYRARLLPLGLYQITVVKEGLAIYQQDGIELTIGDIVTLDISLKPITFEEKIVVTANAPIVETDNVNRGSTVNQKAIETLPLNGRNFENHMLLTPGTVYDDYHVQVAGQRGNANNLMMDGADNNSAFFGEQRGGTRPPFTFSQEAVKEFEVLNNAYSPEFGKATGGIINAVTKSGTNTFFGSTFYYFQNEDFAEKNALGNKFDEFERSQYGATLGGPILRDKLFFFIAYDGQLKDRPIFVTFDDYFTREGDQNGDSFYGDNPEAAEAYDFERWNYDYIQTQDANVILTKLDWIVNSNHQVTIRYNYSRFISENGTVTSGIEQYNGYERTYSSSLVASLTSLLSDKMYNEVKVQYAQEKRPREPNDTTYPYTLIRGSHYLAFGQRTYLPSIVDEKRLQFADNFTWMTDNHEVKAGFDINRLDIDNTFLRYGGGQYEFEGVYDFPNSPSTYIQAWDRTGNDGLVPMDTTDYALFLQDNWQPFDSLTINYGVRYEYQKIPDPDMANPDANILPWWSDDDADRYNPTKIMPDDTNNWAPRIGIAWSPFENKKTVVRAGYGRFFDRLSSILIAQALSNNGYRIVTMSIGPTHPNFPEYPNRIPTIPEGSALTPDIYCFAPDFELPQTDRFSAGIEREIMKDLSVEIEGIYSKTTHLERKFDINLKMPEYDEDLGRFMFSRVRRNLEFGKIVQFTDDAESEYYAVNVKVNKRFSDSYQFMASYTWSQNWDHISTSNSTELTGYDFPENVYDLDAEWAYSDYDIRHKFVLSGLYELDDLLNLPDWYSLSISGIVLYQSGKPWKPILSGDKNRDGYTSNDSPRYYDEEKEKWIKLGRNSERHPAYKNVDLRISNTFRISNIELEVIAEAFNVFNWDNWTVNFSNMEYSESNPPGLYYGEANYPGVPRQYQIGARIKF
ncbi:TonB-dependent receptor [bacterium]|nr:TonB-dependent receptor [candidate division CSSED10-310 bacterium]